MRKIFISILLLTTILSCRKSDSHKDIDPDSFFIRLNVNGLSYEVTEKEATGECFELSSYLLEKESVKVIELDNNRLLGCPRQPFLRVGIVLDNLTRGTSFIIKTGLRNGNSFDLFNNSESYYSVGEFSSSPAELTVTLTKNDKPGGHIEGTIKGTIVKTTQLYDGNPPIYKTVPVEGSFRVLSK